MTRLSERQARELFGAKYEKPSKYHAKKTYVDGIKFDSKHEAEYYCTLLLRKKAGEITGFDLQPEYVLQEAYKRNGKTIRAIKYIADFRVYYPDGRVEVVDCKGVRTKEYLLKKKLLLKQNPDMWFTEA